MRQTEKSRGAGARKKNKRSKNNRQPKQDSEGKFQAEESRKDSDQ
jgi:hypothetical protein